MPHTQSLPIYFIVMSTGYVHGVYGEALRDMALECAAKIPLAVVFRAPMAHRPSVGSRVTPQTSWSVVPCV